MQNSLKRETMPVISILRKAHIRTVMITGTSLLSLITNIDVNFILGDNIETAISVARDCGIVDISTKIISLKVDAVDDRHIFCDYIDDTSNVPFSKFEFENEVRLLCKISGSVMQNNFFAQQECNFALDGRTWSRLCELHPHLVSHVILRTTIFARFQPDQKTEIIQCLQKLDYIACMVGDGANDCGVSVTYKKNCDTTV